MDQNGDKMRTNLIITDDFYNNPIQVREYALSLPFDQTGNYPGFRTQTTLNESTKTAIQQMLQPFAGKITNWNDTDGLSGSFQITTEFDESWIHTDHYNTWAGVCYLTPDAPLSGGTGLFRYKNTKSMYRDNIDHTGETQDMNKWEAVDRIGNVFNRLILYRSDMFHMSLDYFGTTPSNGRLFQVFFLNTEQ